jgi:hypothetical protein
VALLEVVVVLALVGLGLYTILRALTNHGSPPITSGPGQWRTTHYDDRHRRSGLRREVPLGHRHGP